jgi:hypothetical protein
METDLREVNRREEETHETRENGTRPEDILVNGPDGFQEFDGGKGLGN